MNWFHARNMKYKMKIHEINREILQGHDFSRCHFLKKKNGWIYFLIVINSQCYRVVQYFGTRRAYDVTHIHAQNLNFMSQKLKLSMYATQWRELKPRFVQWQRIQFIFHLSPFTRQLMFSNNSSSKFLGG